MAKTITATWLGGPGDGNVIALPEGTKHFRFIEPGNNSTKQLSEYDVPDDAKAVVYSAPIRPNKDGNLRIIYSERVKE